MPLNCSKAQIFIEPSPINPSFGAVPFQIEYWVGGDTMVLKGVNYCVSIWYENGRPEPQDWSPILPVNTRNVCLKGPLKRVLVVPAMLMGSVRHTSPKLRYGYFQNPLCQIRRCGYHLPGKLVSFAELHQVGNSGQCLSLWVKCLCFGTQKIRSLQALCTPLCWHARQSATQSGQ